MTVAGEHKKVWQVRGWGGVVTARAGIQFLWGPWLLASGWLGPGLATIKPVLL